MTLDQKVKAYHYTNSIDYQRIKNGHAYGKTGLVPIKRFAHYDIHGLPEEAHNGSIFCLSEPEPKSWTENKEFPHVWDYFMNHVSKWPEMVLLSFDIVPNDKAYVVDWAHIERMLRKEKKQTEQQKTIAYRKYWNSRVPISKYDGSYSLPEIAVFSPIELERLKLEWEKSLNLKRAFIIDKRPRFVETKTA